MKLYAIGYGNYKEQGIKSMVSALKRAGVTTLVDIRHSPCSPNPKPHPIWGPKDWNLQAQDTGIINHLRQGAIEYRWIVELGNPQKNDKNMTILKAHIASGDENWPVNRGLKLLLQLSQPDGKLCCLLCACEEYGKCHRQVIAEALRDRSGIGVASCILYQALTRGRKGLGALSTCLCGHADRSPGSHKSRFH